MTPTTREKIKRAYRNGFSQREISRMYKLRPEEVAAVIRPNAGDSKGRKQAEIRERAIAELVADGCDPLVIRANF